MKNTIYCHQKFKEKNGSGRPQTTATKIKIECGFPYNGNLLEVGLKKATITIKESMLSIPLHF